MTRTVYATFDRIEQAEPLRRALAARGIGYANVSVIPPEAALLGAPIGGQPSDRSAESKRSSSPTDPAKQTPKAVLGSGTLARWVAESILQCQCGGPAPSLAACMEACGMPPEMVRLFGSAHHAGKTIVAVELTDSAARDSSVERACVRLNGRNVVTIDA